MKKQYLKRISKLKTDKQDKLKKVGKTTRPFRYDLNHIPYAYTVEVRNRFKGLDLIECLMNYGWRFVTLYRRHLYLVHRFHRAVKTVSQVRSAPRSLIQSGVL